MKGLKLLLACTIAFSTVAPALAKQDEPGKVRAFLQKHRGKIAAGVALAAAIGTAITVALHVDKTQKAIEEANIDPKYENVATVIVGLLGWVGENRLIRGFEWATKTDFPGLMPKQKIVTNEEFGFLIATNIDDAFAQYIYPDSFRNRQRFKLRFKAIIAKKYISAAKKKMEKAAESLDNAASKLKANAKSFLGL